MRTWADDAERALQEADRCRASGDTKAALKQLWKARHQATRMTGSEKQDVLERVLASADRLANASADAFAGEPALFQDLGRLRATAARDTGAVSPAAAPYRVGMPVTTAVEVPGFRVTGYIGEVFGVIVRSRGALPSMGADLKSIVGGELKTMTNLLEQSRREAIDRMVIQARHRGADAVIGMRFDTETMAEQWIEVCAYGTAVTTAPIEGSDNSVTAESG